MDALVPQQPLPPPVYVPIQKARTTFGSLVTAMAIGALLAVSLLYYWGSQVEHGQQLASPPTEQRP